MTVGSLAGLVGAVVAVLFLFGVWVLTAKALAVVLLVVGVVVLLFGGGALTLPAVKRRE